jgi:SPP1 gp7 family putative phage head morphogenesis protein
VLREGITNGRGMEWMTEAWRKLVGASAYDTARLLKTETMAMYNRGLKDSYLEMGVEYVEIVGDAECGGICLDYVDGDPIPLEGAEINVELPPYHPNCACSFVSYEETKIVEENVDEDEENLEN